MMEASKMESNNNVEREHPIVPETQENEEEHVMTLEPKKVYWDEEEEFYVHASRMHYDPSVKACYTFIDQRGGDLRPLYYVQSGSDFMIAARGTLGQSNKIVLEDKSWAKMKIYNVKSPSYKPGLLKLFKEKF